MGDKIVDAEFTDVDGSEKGGKRILERLADIAEHAADPIGVIPGAEKVAARVKHVAVVAREVDGIIEEAKPIARKVESTIEKMYKIVGLEDFDSRDVLKR